MASRVHTKGQAKTMGGIEGTVRRPSNKAQWKIKVSGSEY